MKRVFNDRKNLYVILSIVLCSVLSLTIVYAAMSTVLNITGSANVVASNWDIHLDNVNLIDGSSGNVPTITSNTSASFSTVLSTPGDFYEFTIDVVNDGTIDAMIDSVVKNPTLTSSQAKYISYDITYQNGDSINAKHLVEAGSYVRLRVKVGYRKDISVSDLPTSATSLNLSFSVVYVQSDNTGSVIANNGKLFSIVKGDLSTIGSEICINKECFYVFDNDGSNVKLLSKYNLLIGNKYDGTSVVSLENTTGLQDSTAVGAVWDESGTAIYPWLGTIGFSNTSKYLDDYSVYFSGLGLENFVVRNITTTELVKLGCSGSSCLAAPGFVYSTTYWSDKNDLSVNSKGDFGPNRFTPDTGDESGIRPVVVIDLNEIDL